MFGLPKHSKAFTIWIDLIDLHINRISELVLFHSKPLCTSYSFGKKILEFSPLQFFRKIFLLIFAIWTGKTSPDHERRRQTSSPGRRHCHPDADVVARALKFGVFVKNHPSHAADVIARARTLSPGRMRCRLDADVVTRALKFGVFVKKHPSLAAPVVTRAQVLSPARMRSRLGACVAARA